MGGRHRRRRDYRAALLPVLAGSATMAVALTGVQVATDPGPRPPSRILAALPDAPPAAALPTPSPSPAPAPAVDVAEIVRTTRPTLTRATERARERATSAAREATRTTSSRPRGKTPPAPTTRAAPVTTSTAPIGAPVEHPAAATRTPEPPARVTREAAMPPPAAPPATVESVATTAPPPATTTPPAATPEATTPPPTPPPTATTPPPPPSPAPAPTEATEARVAETATETATCSTAPLAGTRPHVSAAGRRIAERFGVPESRILGRSGRPGNPNSDHPNGLALDFLVGRTTGDRIAAYALANQDELGVSYVIWQQQINSGSGWKAMEDRGSPTANHEDHVHISFRSDGGLSC